MDWLRLAFGLIRDAASTDAGKEVIEDLKSAASRKEVDPTNPTTYLETLRASVEANQRRTDHNIDMVVRMVNAQQEALARIQKKQRVWNVALAVGVGIALALIVMLFLRTQ